MDAAKVAEITGHRFEGYTNGMLAIEVEQFQAGQGAGSISEAVEALKAIATGLADTDEALRRGMQELGVAWQSGPAEQAKSIFGGNVDFASDAKAKVNSSAQVAFVLGEAYSGMVNKLPDPAVLRAGDEGLNIGDLLGGLIGHETDHAAKVKAARAARDQAIDALSEFQRTCSDELNSVEALNNPESLLLDGAPAAERPATPDDSIAVSAASAVSELGRPDDSSNETAASRSDGGVSSGPTVGKGDDDCPPEETHSAAPRSTADLDPVAERTSPASTAPSVSTGTPAPVVGIVPPGAAPGGGPAPGAPGTPGTPGSPGVPGAGGVVGTPGGTGGSSSSSGRPGGPVTPGAPGGSAGGPGGAAGAAAGKFGGGDASRLGSRLGFGGGFGGAPDVADPLAKGKFSGATPPPPAAQPTTPPAVPPAAAAGGALSGVAGGAAAIAAGATAGAISGEEDRDRRARDYGKGQDVDGRPLHQIDVGEIPDEQAAENVEHVEPKAGDDAPKYLEQAAVQPGVSDATRVRTHGVDDVDLFADQRMAAPEVIGDDPAAAYNANRKEDQ